MAATMPDKAVCVARLTAARRDVIVRTVKGPHLAVAGSTGRGVSGDRGVPATERRGEPTSPLGG